MHDQNLAQQSDAVGCLLLQAPSDALIQAIQCAEVAIEAPLARQDFYDFLCIAQSGCYIPPFAHVLAHAVETEEFWHFPSARHDGGDSLLLWYDVIGFDPSTLTADPFITGSNRPYDHIGVLFSFLALLLDTELNSDTNKMVITEFIDDHLEPAVPLLIRLLAKSGSPYIELISESLNGFWQALRHAYPRRKISLIETAWEPSDKQEQHDSCTYSGTTCR